MPFLSPGFCVKLSAKKLDEWFALCLLKNSFSAKTASTPVIENVFPVRKSRL
jgi:hypothetical protein